MKAAAIVGWTGLGRFEDLERTAAHKLGEREKGGRIDDTLIVDTADPVSVARRLALLPGVAWISVGYRFSGSQNYLRNLELLARRYLSKGRTFSIAANVVRSKVSAGDIVLSGNSALLSAIPGARINERKPQVKFRVCVDAAKGACGVEIRTGPGGLPTGAQWVSCLVSGGERSASLAWMSALNGFSLRLVHSSSGEAPLRQVAKLYSELSFRMDPSRLELVVLDGRGGAIGRIGRWLREDRGANFAGARLKPDAWVDLARAFPNLGLPLSLVQEEVIAATYRSLGIGRAAREPLAGAFGRRELSAQTNYSEHRFGGVQADSNEVIDSIKRAR